MNGDRIFVDSNIWLYAFVDNSDPRHQVALKLLKQTEQWVISSQVVSEVCVNLLKKAGRDESFIQRLIFDFHSKYTVTPIDESIHLAASQLRENYSLSYWDSMICSAALEMGCAKLFSEDMQHGLRINDGLEIVNPFKSP
jgi:predicted nucleic acid-binding protein